MKRGDRCVFTLTFPVTLSHLDTDEKVEALELLAQCDGARDPSDLADLVRHWVPELEVRGAIPRLWLDGQARELVMRLDIVLDREPTPEEQEELRDFAVDEVMWGGWGANHQFELPESLQDYVVSLGKEPREKIASPSSDAIAEHARRYVAEGRSYLEKLAPARALELRDLIEAKGIGGDEVIAIKRDLDSLLHKRAAAAAGVGVGTITLDNIDAIDDLPPDVF
jgi:hypothetical protein